MIFALLLVSTFVSVRGDCEALKCLKSDKQGTPAVIQQFPYVAAVAEIKNPTPFCLGTLLSLKHVLTTCSCVHVLNEGKYERREDTSILITAGGVDRNVQKIKSSTIHYHKTCPLPWEYMIENDFSVVEGENEFKSLGTGRFVSLKDGSAITKSFEELLKKKEKCFIFGYGKYQVLNEKSSSEDGSLLHRMERYEMTLSGECKGCCEADKWLEKGHKCGGVKKCGGGSGSPVVCDGKIYGVLRGHVPCKDKGVGPQIFIPIEFGLQFLYNYYEDIIPTSVPPSEGGTGSGESTVAPGSKTKAQANRFSSSMHDYSVSIALLNVFIQKLILLN